MIIGSLAYFWCPTFLSSIIYPHLHLDFDFNVHMQDLLRFTAELHCQLKYTNHLEKVTPGPKPVLICMERMQPEQVLKRLQATAGSLQTLRPNFKKTHPM
jgi:hypothetical protein